MKDLRDGRQAGRPDRRRRHGRLCGRTGSRGWSSGGSLPGVSAIAGNTLGRQTEPAEESATFKRVRQARRHELWRVAHPFDPEVSVRVICWFPADDEVVIALIGFDKKTIGDVFYASAAARGEALVDAWLRPKGSTDDRES